MHFPFCSAEYPVLWRGKNSGEPLALVRQCSTRLVVSQAASNDLVLGSCQGLVLAAHARLHVPSCLVPAPDRDALCHQVSPGWHREVSPLLPFAVEWAQKLTDVLPLVGGKLLSRTWTFQVSLPPPHSNSCPLCNRSYRISQLSGS